MKKKRRDFSPREQRMVDEFITRICKFLHISDKSGDLHQYAWEAFLSVYRDCPDSFCGTGFLGWKRAFSIIWDALVEERKERYRNLFQQISLNQPIGNETPVLRIELLQAPHGDFQNGVCLRDYLQRMNRDACRMPTA